MYVAKRHVPKTCDFCSLPAPPWQSREKTLAGSRWWMRGYHTLCLLKDTYKDVSDLIYAQNPFWKMIKPTNGGFEGAYFSIPIKFGR